MKKLVLVGLLMLQQLVFGQSKTSVAILNMTNDSDFDKTTVGILQETVVNAIFSTKRFTIVDRQRLEELEKEKKLQKTEAFMDNNTKIKDGVSIGASYLISPSLITYESKSGPKVQIRVLDVSTGEILASEIITSNQRRYSDDIIDVIKDHSDKKDKKTLDDDIFGATVLDAFKINVVDFINLHLPDPVAYKFVSEEELDQKEILSEQKEGVFLLKGNTNNYFKRGDLFKIPGVGNAVMVGVNAKNQPRLAVYQKYDKKFKFPKDFYLVSGNEDKIHAIRISAIN